MTIRRRGCPHAARPWPGGPRGRRRRSSQPTDHDVHARHLRGAGLVPCAEEGIRQTLRGPRRAPVVGADGEQARILALARRNWAACETASKPVIAAQLRPRGRRSARHSPPPGRAGAKGWSSANSGQRDRHHLGGGVELHRAGAERDHRPVEREVRGRRAGACSAASRSRRDHVEDRMRRDSRSCAASASGSACLGWKSSQREGAAEGLPDRLDDPGGRVRLVERDADAVVVDLAQVDAGRPAPRSGRRPGSLPASTVSVSKKLLRLDVDSRRLVSPSARSAVLPVDALRDRLQALRPVPDRVHARP